MIDIEQLEYFLKQATERSIKIHDALDIPYITANNNQIVEMLHGEVIRVIEPHHDIVNS
ncbi:MAG: hypothetical protein WCK96_04375 [Methylococcales bacterium]